MPVNGVSDNSSFRDHMCEGTLHGSPFYGGQLKYLHYALHWKEENEK